MKKTFLRTYGFSAVMLLAIAAGCLTGALWPNAARLEPLGTVFINLTFCLVVPLVFCSLAGSVAGMPDRRRAGRILSTTLGVFVLTGIVASLLMLFAVRIFPPVLQAWEETAVGAVDDPTPFATLLVNFFTVNDFSALLSRRAMLPLMHRSCLPIL